jgi:hypothetical protein
MQLADIFHLSTPLTSAAQYLQERVFPHLIPFGPPRPLPRYIGLGVFLLLVALPTLIICVKFLREEIQRQK